MTKYDEEHINIIKNDKTRHVLIVNQHIEYLLDLVEDQSKLIKDLVEEKHGKNILIIFNSESKLHDSFFAVVPLKELTDIDLDAIDGRIFNDDYFTDIATLDETHTALVLLLARFHTYLINDVKYNRSTKTEKDFRHYINPRPPYMISRVVTIICK